MIRKIIEAKFPSAASITFRISSGRARSADIRFSAVRTSCAPRRWWFPPFWFLQIPHHHSFATGIAMSVQALSG
jgi:hypothetical protein